MIGRTLSTYRVVEKIGEGGMGEVYLARDERLGRDVALKVLPEGRLGDERARSRFRKEAQALLRLSHPHVATLFDHGRADGVDYLVMERVAGKTLDVALREGPLPEKEVLRLGAQLARGLAAAHEAGIVHRDLKPSNLALTSDGLLKILDFGLAQLPAEVAVGARTRDTPTQTGAGLVLGSPPYMAPEQLLGKEADARSDVYSAGACLFELATGRRPHGDKNGPMLVEAILHEAPPPARSLNARVTPGLEAVVAKAMDKDPSLRYQGARELLVDIERLAQTPSVTVGAPGVPATPRRRRWAWLTVAVLLAAAGFLAWRLRPTAPPRIASVRPLRAGLSWLSTGGIVTTWATDGLRVYFVDRRGDRFLLLQMPIDGGDSSEIEVPAAFHKGFEVYGFLPRTSSLLCLTVAGASDAGWPAWAISVPGGQARRLGSLRGNSAGVSADGTRIALLQISTRKLVVASEDASVLRTIGPLPQQPGSPSWAPDGKRIRFGGQGPEGQEGQPWVWEVAAEGGTPRPVAPGEQGAWTRDGRFFLIERWNNAERRFDLFVAPDRASLAGAFEPRPLTNGPLSFRLASERPGGRGLLAFGQDARGELRRYDAGTRRFAPFLGGASAGYVDPSPDGEWLAWVTYPGEELWQGRRNGSERFPLAGAPLRAWMPRWSPDGRRIAFIGRAEGERHRSVYVVPAGGGAAEVVVAAPEADWWDACWLSEGSLVFSRRQGATGLQTIDLRSGRVSLLPGSEGLRYPKCGPRGEILATRVSTPGMLVFRRPGQAEWQEAGPNRGVYHSWRRDGRSFCYLLGGAVECDSLDGRSVTRHPLEDTPLRWVDAAPWINLDLDDSPFVTLLIGRPDIYALDWEAP